MKFQVFCVLACPLLLLVGVSSAKAANQGFEEDARQDRNINLGSLRASTESDAGEIKLVDIDERERRLDTASDDSSTSASTEDGTDLSFTTIPFKEDNVTFVHSQTSGSNAPLGQYIQARYEGMKLGAPSRFIPADPHGAAGPSLLIAVVNTNIRAQNKNTGATIWTTSLKSFLGCRGTCFDPKIIYDTHENRFLVVALDADRPALTSSRVRYAISKDNTPQNPSDWYVYSFNSRVSIDGVITWADYPGFEVDEEAIYITANMFAIPRQPRSGFISSRLWILSKRGRYSGNLSAAIPIKFINLRTLTGTVSRFGSYSPAEIRSTDWRGAGRGVGTYLISYGFFGLSIGGGNEALHVLIVLDPIGSNSRVIENVVPLGNIEPLGGNLPNAPQRGSSVQIETNDRRVLDAAWHNNFLWCVFTILSGGRATAYYVKMSTVILPNGNPRIAGVVDQARIRGNDIAGANTYTYFPSIAVNRKGVTAFGFSASSPTTYAGAYVAYHDDVNFRPGLVSRSYLVREGVSPYVRTFGSGRNRWGDYTGIAVDPVDEDCFWVYNKYAARRGSCTAGSSEDGCWGTGWAQFCVRPGIRPGRTQNATSLAEDEPQVEIGVEPTDLVGHLEVRDNVELRDNDAKR